METTLLLTLVNGNSFITNNEEFILYDVVVVDSTIYYYTV